MRQQCSDLGSTSLILDFMKILINGSVAQRCSCCNVNSDLNTCSCSSVNNGVQQNR
jgi:hypothetical protein